MSDHFHHVSNQFHHVSDTISPVSNQFHHVSNQFYQCPINFTMCPINFTMCPINYTMCPIRFWLCSDILSRHLLFLIGSPDLIRTCKLCVFVVRGLIWSYNTLQNNIEMQLRKVVLEEGWGSTEWHTLCKL